MNNQRKLMLCLLVAAGIGFSFSCKKVVDGPGGNGNGAKLDTAGSSLTDRLYDSLYLYASQTYYWNDQLPPYADFLPRQYEGANDLLGLTNEQFQLTRYAKDGSGNLYEQLMKPQYNNGFFAGWVDDNSAPKYSYILKTSETVNGGASSSVGTGSKNSRLLKMTLDGKDSSLGFIPSLVTVGAGQSYDNVKVTVDSTLCIIQWVTNGSPAYNAGLRRGDLVSKINGKAYVDWTDADLDALNSAINAEQIQLTIRDGNTGSKTKTLSFKKELYKFNPIFKDTLINQGGRKIGYLAFQTYSLNADDSLDLVFQNDLKGATDLVIDLRYNGGGYVAVAEHLVNLVAPSTANTKVMYRSTYNESMTNDKAPILKKILIDYDKPGEGTLADVDFSKSDDNPNTTARISKSDGKAGLSSLTSIYFIVSSGTASASELTINSLKPYFPGNLKLIGARFGDDGERTYGKPVGFFEIRFGEYSMWMPNFETKNANNEGGYYNGMPTDYQAFDDVAHDFGDPKEESFADAIAKITGVTTSAAAVTSKSIKRSIIGVRSIGEVIKTDKMIVRPVRLIK